MTFHTHWRRLAGAALAALLPLAAVAQASAPAVPPASAFFARPDIFSAQLSPSGRLLAITTGKGLARTGLFVFDLGKPGSKPATVALYPEIDVVGVQWINDGRLLFRVADLAQTEGRRTAGAGLYAVDPDGGNLRQLIKRSFNEKADDDTRAAAARLLDPNHQLLAVPLHAKDREDAVLIGQNFGTGAGEFTRQVPMWLNTRTGLTRKVETHGAPDGSVDWLFDPHGEPRVALTMGDNKRAVYWRGDKGWLQIATGDAEGLPFRPVAVDGAGQLFVSRREGPEGYSVLARYNPATGAPETEPLVRTPGYDFSGDVIIGPDSPQALGIRTELDTEVPVWWNAEIRKLQAEIDQKLPGRVNQVACRRCDQDDMIALVHTSTDRDPGQYFIVRGKDRQWQSIGRTMSGIDPSQMARVDFQRIKARDGRDLPVWLTLPKGAKPGNPLPTVVLVHGGPWVRGGHWGYSAYEQFLASRGYLVISPEFRGSTGYGDAHFRAGHKQWGQAMQDDVADALLWAQQQKLASDRACIAGASYGGYGTLMGLVRHPELYRCGIAWVGVSDPLLLVEGSSLVETDVDDESRKHSLPIRIGDPVKDAAMFKQISPIEQAHRIKAPLILAYGEADVRVPLAHGTRMRDALRKAGNEPIYVTYPGEGHSWQLPETRADFAQRMERFLAQHLAPSK